MRDCAMAWSSRATAAMCVGLLLSLACAQGGRSPRPVAPGDAGMSGDAERMGDTGTMMGPCAEGERVQGGACVPCAAGTTHAAGDDPSGMDTACEALLCAADELTASHACVPCAAGTSNEAGDDASGADTVCDSVPCPMGSTGTDVASGCICNPGTVGEIAPSTVGPYYAGGCMPILCTADEHVMGNTCAPCAAGTSNAMGDDASQVDTTCDPAACPAGSTGMDVTSGCTCDAGYSGRITPSTTSPYYTGSCAAVACPAGSTGTDVPSGCTCLPGYAGTITSSTTSPYYAGACTRVTCAADERVVSHACVRCPAGTRNAPGDDASMLDTTCDSVACPVNSTGASVAIGCTCNPGFAGTITGTTTPPYYRGACTPASTSFRYTGTIATYAVPAGVTRVRIDASGSAGGDGRSGGGRGGWGARMSGVFNVTPGTWLTVYVGGGRGLVQRGGDCTYVAIGSTPLVVAGGGGGAGYGQNGVAAPVTQGGTAATAGTVSSGTNGTPGSGGAGGGAGNGTWGTGGGGGWSSAGASGSGTPGGAFRCMGSAGSTYAGGAGGGYSGGGGAAMASGWGTRAGGSGGSFNSGSSQSNTAGANAALGSASITAM